MDDRLHKALDDALDDLQPAELTPKLAGELDEARALFDGVVRAIPVRPIPDLGAAVLRRIAAADDAPRRLHVDGLSQHGRSSRGVAAWLWSPRHITLSMRPAYALAAALVVAVGIGAYNALGATRERRPDVAATSVNTGTDVLVHFQLAAPKARTVELAGDFSHWSPAYSMERTAPGVWTVVVPLAPGVHEYAFIVDGRKWVPDPAAPPMPDGFGGINSRVAVLSPDRRT
jgi:hypothetical protein